MLDTDGQISNICNFAHAQDIPAKIVLEGINEEVEKLGEKATEYQKETKERVAMTLMTLSLNSQNS
ncbi:MAG: hypothetical protein PHS92_02780 [Candidatus Gracilibacteria bacterium]|nr:hypothetical protein [Candidatus Gracilibacteria bacterium]